MNIIKTHGPIGRAEVARRSGLSPATVTGITADLGTAGSTYLGGTLQLQSQLHADGIPCVTTVLESGGLNVIWSTATV